MVTLTTTFAVCVAAVGSHSRADMLYEKVDLIEINHCYDEKGQLVFDQLLFYDWCPARARYDVRDWRLLRSATQVPKRDPHTGLHVVIWRDGQTLRKVHAETVRESWTQYDPEIVEQQHLAKEHRRAFVKVSQRRVAASATATHPMPPAESVAQLLSDSPPTRGPDVRR